MGDLGPGQTLFRNSSEETKAKLEAMRAQQAAASSTPVDPMAKALEEAKAQVAAAQAQRAAAQAKPVDPVAKALEDAKAQMAAAQAKRAAPEAKPADPVAQALEEAKARMAAAQARRAMPEAAPPEGSPFKGSPDETKAKLAALKANRAMGRAEQAAGAKTVQSCPGASAPGLDRTPAPAAGPRVHPRTQMHMDMMAECEKLGTETVAVTTPVKTVYPVKVHAADPEELVRVSRALRNLGAADKHDLIMRNVKNVYIVDDLPTDKNAAIAGRAVKLPSGETAVFLSRMKNNLAENRLHGQNHVNHVLFHEIGHVVDNRYNLSAQSEAGFGKGSMDDKDFVSNYAGCAEDERVRQKEDYAECFAFYFEARTNAMTQGAGDKVAANYALAQVGKKERKSSKASDKLNGIHQGLTPELHCEEQMNAVVAGNKAKGATEDVIVRKFYDDPEFRQSYVQAATKRSPAASRESVYSHMEKKAFSLGQDPTPGGGRLT